MAGKPERIWDGRGDALEDARLTQAAGRMADDLRLKETHLRIMAHVGRQNGARGWLRVSQSELSERWDIHRNTVNKAFGQLVAWGYLMQRTQQDAGESFCLYKVALDDEAELPPEARTRGREGGECTPTSAPPGDMPQGGECTPTSAPVHSQECTRVRLESAPPTIYPRAHRLPPSSAEEKSPKSPQAGTSCGNSGDEQGMISARQAGWLDQLAGESGHDGNALDLLIAPVLRQRRFSSATPLEDLRTCLAMAKGLPPDALRKAWQIVADSGVGTVKPARLRAAIEAVRKGGAMVVVKPGSPQWAAWVQHFEETKPAEAALMRRSGVWQVRAEWPPSKSNPGAAA